MPRTTRLVLLATVSVLAAGSLNAQGSTVNSGTDVLDLMHKKYANKWYTTLTFTQKTTLHRNGGTTEQTWYESLAFKPVSGAYLRIDQGSIADGNGSLSTADSTWGVHAGKQTSARGSGNPFLSLIENVYLQPVAVTVKQLGPLQFDLSKVTSEDWEGRPAWVVGVTSASDSTAPQFWIDKERLVVVRMLLNLAPPRPPFDIHLDDLVQTGGGWLATKVDMLVGGMPQQTEEYSGWQTNVKLDPKLFNPATWSTAKHWVKPQ